MCGAGPVRPTSVVVTIGQCTVHHNTAPSLLTHSFTRVSFFHTCQWQCGIAQMISIKHLSQIIAVNYGGVLNKQDYIKCFTYRGCSQVQMRWWEKLPSWMRLVMLWRRRGPPLWSSPSRTGPSPRLRPASASILSWSPETRRGTRHRSCPGTFPPQSSTLCLASISITPSPHKSLLTKVI